MKKIIVLLVFIPFLMVSAVSATPLAEGVQNTSFECWTAGDADDWTKFNTHLEDDKESLIYRKGDHSSALTVAAGQDSSYYQVVVGIDDETPYTISIWAYDDDDDGHLRLYGFFRNADHDNIGTAVQSTYAYGGIWQELVPLDGGLPANPVTAPTGAVEFFFDIQLYNVGSAGPYTIYVDDASVDGLIPEFPITVLVVFTASAFMIVVVVVYRKKRTNKL